MSDDLTDRYMEAMERHPYSVPQESGLVLLGSILMGLMIGCLGGCGLALAIGVIYALFMISLEIHIAVTVIYTCCVLLGGIIGVRSLT